MSLEEPVLNARETALCQAIASVTNQVFGEQLEKPPLYEALWAEAKKESKWAPTLSLIPITHKTSYGVNIQVMQRLFFKGGKNEIFINYKAISPKKDRAMITGIEMGGFADYVIPRGLMLTSKILYIENKEDRKNQKIANPLMSAFRREIHHQKKSKLMKRYNSLSSSTEYNRYNITSPRYILVAPRVDRTMIIVSSCANTLKGPKVKVDLENGRSQKIRFGVPDSKMLSNVVSMFGQLARYCEPYKCDYSVSGGVLDLGRFMPLYLALEENRRRLYPDGPTLSLKEAKGHIESSRLETLLKAAVSQEPVSDVKPTTKPKQEPKPKFRQLKCTNCGAVYSYAESEFRPNGTVKCKNCVALFTPSKEEK